MTDKDPLYIPDEQDDLPIVYKVIGAPGTGKTTRVVGNPDLGLDGLYIDHLDHYSFEEQMIVTYTNAGVDEAADRLYRMTDIAKYKIEDRVTTIHGQCYRLLGLEREQVVQHYNKKNFCDVYDLDFGYDDDEQDLMGADLDDGNALFRIYSWLQSNMKPLDEWEDCPIEWDHDKDPLFLMEKWVDYKKGNDLVGFGDMIEMVVKAGYKQLESRGLGYVFPPEDADEMEMFIKACNDNKRDPDVLRGNGVFIDTKVLYVDEVQDLSPLQWAWYLLQKNVCEKVFIGGDDDQTIYGWAGANPEFMLGEEGEFEVLDKTYRIPKNIWEVCDGVIDQVDVRQEKEVQPDGDGGEFYPLKAPAFRRIASLVEKEDDVMILARANYMVNEITKKLHEYGIPYDNMSTFETWDDDIIKIRDGISKIMKGEDKIKGQELRTMMEYANDNMIRSDNGMGEQELVMGQLGGIDMKKVHKIFQFKGGVMDSSTFDCKQYLNECTDINYYQKEAILGSVRHDREHLNYEDVRVGTIHSAKGKEAETVIVATDSTKTILGEMQKDLPEGERAGITDITDSERRVYYVGMTRASEKLVLAQGLINPEIVITLEALLKDAEDFENIGKDWESNPKRTGTSW